ncbi:MAG: Sec-independent protein translocase protein TatB [Pseudomonadota bacterium]
MFGIDFSELIVIGIVALVVIGPERLPKVARTAGYLLGRLQRYVAGVKADITREMELDELRKFRSEMQNTAHMISSSIQQEVSLAEQEIRTIGQHVSQPNEGATLKIEDTKTPDLFQELTETIAEPSPQLELSLNSNSSSNRPS